MPDVTPKMFPKGGVFKNLLGGDMHSHERLLVNFVSTTRLPTLRIYDSMMSYLLFSKQLSVLSKAKQFFLL